MFVGLLSIWAKLAISNHCKAPSFVVPNFISTNFIPKISSVCLEMIKSLKRMVILMLMMIIHFQMILMIILIIMIIILMIFIMFLITIKIMMRLSGWQIPNILVLIHFIIKDY